MNRAGHEQADFFVGREVEHSPAFGQLTMFVVGLQSMEAITQAIDTHYKLGGKPITHVYFGANQSFPNPETDDGNTWREWEGMITKCLQQGLLCTLDLDVSSAEGLVEGCLIEYNNFIPMISVKLPSLQLLGYNATIKLDDKDFAATNPGVWCHQLHDLKDRKVFTDWSKYTKDEVIK
jgi:hypothetical protein